MTRRVVALGLDAADHRLIKRLAGEGRMPHVAKLLSDGARGTVRSPAWLGSGAVWPTFVSGRVPHEHGLFSEYSWDPRSMTLRRPDFARLVPFWRTLADRGRRAAILDVPFTPVVGHERLVEVVDWGAHDWLGGPCIVSPGFYRKRLGGALAAHPYVTRPGSGSHRTATEYMRSAFTAALEGARLRGDLIAKLWAVAAPHLLLAVFPETHRASHALWHTVEPSDDVRRRGIAHVPDDLRDALPQIFTAIDEQIGRLLSLTGDDTTVIVFSLHGMQPARGVPDFLADVLERWGYQRRRSAWGRSPREHVAALSKYAKSHAPAAAKAAYYRRVPKQMTLKLAQPNMAVLDWTVTRAFSLPTDQHGWIRLNLRGRESEGIVEPSAYSAACADLERRLGLLESSEGRLVSDVVRTANDGDLPDLLPDLVVHWSEATQRSQLEILDPPLRSTPREPWVVGQHDDDGFYVASGPGAERLNGDIESTSIAAWIASVLEAK